MNFMCQFILLASIVATVFAETNIQTVDVTCEYEANDWEVCTITDVDFRYIAPNNLNIRNADATADTTHFRMATGRYKVMPSNLFQLFPKLKKLEISIGLKAITKENLIGGSKLEELDLSYNKIRAIEAHTFDGMDKLEFIDLRNNKLTKVESNAFAGASNLKNLDLNSNDIDTIEDGAFNILTLEEINLSGNSLDTLADDVFVGCPELRRVYLYGNEFTRIGKSIENVPKLSDVTLMTNMYKIADFDFYAIARKPELETYFAENVALVLETSAANDNYTAVQLDISGNNLLYPDILHRLRNFRNLIRLNLSYNNFTTINDLENLFEYFPKLEELEVNGIPCKEEVFQVLHTKFADKVKLKYTFES